MKMNRIMTAAVLAIMALVSCQKDGLGDGLDRFAAYQEGAATKTVLDGLAPLWTPAEKISLYDGKNNIFTAELTETAASATFKGKLEGQAGRSQYLAVSPYSGNYDFMSKTVYNVLVPSQQNAVKGSYDPDAMVSMAFSMDKTLNFRNICSLVKFTVVCDGVTSVKLEANDETALAGGFYATWGDDGIPKITVYPKEKSSSIVLEGEFEKGGTYYISTLPAVLNDGFTMTLNGSREVRRITSPVSLARSGMVNLGNISLDPAENEDSSTPGDDNGDNGGNGNEGGNTGNEGDGNEGGNTGNEGNEGGNEGGNTGDEGGNTGGDTGNGGNADMLYLQPGPWEVDGPRFEAYFFGDGEAWAVMTDADKDGVYECEIPDGFSKVIFCRMDPAKPENNWDSKWNQTVDLDISGRLFTITDPWGNDGNDHKATGTWSE